MTWDKQRVSFGANAAGYDSHRPDWPAPTAVWLTGTEPGSGREGATLDVVDLGAGTGKLTQTLAGLGHRVTAVEPDAGMLEVLSAKLPQVRAVQAGAEQIPLPDHSVDVITVAQAWHWTKQPEAALECARVLRPGGVLAIAWHYRDQQVPWVAELNRLTGGPEWALSVGGHKEAVAAGEATVHSRQTLVDLPEPFGPDEQVTFEYTLRLPPSALPELVASWSYVAGRPDRDQVLEQVGQLAERVAAEQANSGRELALPHRTQCHRARTAPN